MAKTTIKSGNSRIRFIMLEADLADGDLTQITSAISQAIRPTQAPIRQIGHSSSSFQAGSNMQGASPAVEELEGAVGLENDPVDHTEVTPSARRRFPTPKVLGDVDLNSGDIPFEKFANEKGPKTTISRYLVVAYWFKTYRQVESVNMNHVFTCFKKMGWGTDIKDFTQPLRDNARQGRGEVKKGEFTINHIGEDVVEKMNPE
jgi:hypothetical protein